MRLLVTGATGYIGEQLVRVALSRGHEVIAASRRLSSARIGWIPFDLSSTSEIAIPDGIDVVFHLAAVTSASAVDPDIELGAARRLSAAAAGTGARIVFVSSQTAREDAPTAYGRTKWQIERLILAAGGWVVRPGQVYGGPERGLFGMLVGMVRRIPVIPAFFPPPKVQPVHVNDLVAALLHCAESNSVPSSVLCIGAVEPVSFTDFLRTIAQFRVRRYRLPIPVPVLLIRLASAVLGGRLRARLGLDRLTSLFDLPAMETRRDLLLLGVSLRPLPSGMTRSGDGRRRRLIHEGQALLKYVLKARPAPALVRRYVRGIESLRGGQPLHLPEVVLRLPVTIALLDDSAVLETPGGAEFTWRLNTAVVLAEASVQGARRFLAIGKTSNWVNDLAHMTCAVALELLWWVARLVAGPVMRALLRQPAL